MKINLEYSIPQPKMLELEIENITNFFAELKNKNNGNRSLLAIFEVDNTEAKYRYKAIQIDYNLPYYIEIKYPILRYPDGNTFTRIVKDFAHPFNSGVPSEFKEISRKKFFEVYNEIVDLTKDLVK